MLLGEAGVGKTAVVEKLAQEIVAGRVPAALQHKRIVELSMSQLVSGTSYRGQFEEKLQALFSEIQLAGDVVVLIDEFHMVMRAGDVGSNLKPALARGEITCIGITTQDELANSSSQITRWYGDFKPWWLKNPPPTKQYKF